MRWFLWIEVEVPVGGGINSEISVQMAYNDFTEMPVWQSANKVVKQVYQLCVKLPRSEEYALPSQMKRAGL
jgi:hypothetical protein